MNDEVITDLKQFIATTVSQQMSELRTDLSKKIDKLDQKINGVNDSLSKKIDKLDQRATDIDHKTDAILEAVGEKYEDTDKTFKNHERRIKKLEAKIA